jgi:hypothetical protein
MNCPPTVRIVHRVTRDHERSDSRWQLLDRIRTEYDRLPDLRLTSWQACRLWSLTPSLCDVLFEALVSERFLKRTVDGAYLRRGMGRQDVDRVHREARAVEEPHEVHPEDESEFRSLGV